MASGKDTCLDWHASGHQHLLNSGWSSLEFMPLSVQASFCIEGLAIAKGMACMPQTFQVSDDFQRRALFGTTTITVPSQGTCQQLCRSKAAQCFFAQRNWHSQNVMARTYDVLFVSFGFLAFCLIFICSQISRMPLQVALQGKSQAQSILYARSCSIIRLMAMLELSLKT